MSATETWRRAGEGTAVWSGEPVDGVVREVRTTEDVIALLNDVPPDLIVLMHTAGATILAPLFSDIKGIVCTAGNVGSHVAILAREFGVPCLVGTRLAVDDLAGRHVRLDPAGAVEVRDE